MSTRYISNSDSHFRLAVKSLIDKSCFDTMGENSPEIVNFCNIMEHVLSHRIKRMYNSNVPGMASNMLQYMKGIRSQIGIVLLHEGCDD